MWEETLYYWAAAVLLACGAVAWWQRRMQTVAPHDALSALPHYHVLVFNAHGELLVRVHGNEQTRQYAPALYGAFESAEAPERAVRQLVGGDAAVQFVSCLPQRERRAPLCRNVYFAADQCVASYDWLFVVDVPDNVSFDANLIWMAPRALYEKAYDAELDFALALPLQLLGAFAVPPAPNCKGKASLRSTLRVLTKSHASLMPSPATATVNQLRDFTLLDACYYTFDNPGKGVRSSLVRGLAKQFPTDQQTLSNLCSFIEQFHQLSLIVDDIQDDSTLRRQRMCAHLAFGTPEALGAAYFQLFRLLRDIPSSFPYKTQKTTQLVLEGCTVAHRGQGQDVAWRERHYCPSEAQWLQMARGKTAAPFELTARLLFLQCSFAAQLYLLAARALAFVAAPFVALFLRDKMGRDTEQRDVIAKHDSEWNLWDGMRRLMAVAMVGDIEEAIIDLCSDVGVYFQIRDDYINLVDSDYWKLKGFCDDLHEKKFSYPVVQLVHQRLPGYKKFLKLYAENDVLNGKQVREAVGILKQSGALDVTRRRLVEFRAKILSGADLLVVRDLTKLMMRLEIPDEAKPAEYDQICDAVK